ncbi:MAG: acetyl-CoA carboxylase carboxyl transferase subunit alpha/beta [Proteobacteria bacterium]|nr:acetyl-CoA carboxylase carboxyl transferase subunit alpha/beta [Pseudomonadota bacterium]
MAKMDILDLFKKRTRSPLRPRSGDLIINVFPHFRQHPPYGGSLILGEAEQWERHFFIVAQQKPRPRDLRTKEDLAKLNYGMLTAEEHSHILGFLDRAQKRRPEKAVLVSLIDTYGADISMESARDFQAFFIAQLIRAYIEMPMPSISIVVGEGGSGGALAIQYADRRAQFEDALYATAPPESMAAIIFRDPTRIREALEILKPTAGELKELGVIDQVLHAPKDVSDIPGYARFVGAYLEKTAKELGRIKIARLMEERRARAEAFGLPRQKSFDWRKFVRRTPLKKKGAQTDPPDMKIFLGEDTALQVEYDYGNGLAGHPGQEYVKCGETSSKGGPEDGCGEMIPLETYQDNHYVCPRCGAARVMGAMGWINCLADRDSFHELYRNLTVEELLDASLLTPHYRKFVQDQTKRTHFKESLVTGEASIHGNNVVMAVCEFYFSGGSMGVVFGEKFNRAVDYAIEKRYPLVSLCCSGGARLYEGILALMQMVKTVNAVKKLKEHGLPYLSILGDPSTGGAIASYAALGDVVIAEPGAMVIFAGPRVMKSRGFPVDESAIRAESLHRLAGSIFDRLEYFRGIRGIHEVAARSDMKRVISKYLEFYDKSKC